MNTKVCSKCGEIKPITEFTKNKNSKDGLKCMCKSCAVILGRKYRKDHADKKKETCSNYRKNNKEKIKEQSKKYYKRTKEERKKYNQKWHQENKAKHRAKIKEWIDKHREELNARDRERRKADNLYRLRNNLRNVIRRIFLNGKFLKNKSTEEILGCTYEFFKEYIEAKFTNGMTWDNYGKWHIDHIIPLSSAKTEEEMYMLSRYTNMQPLWAKDNLSKGHKVPDNVQLKLL
jgi:hypothetical protein